jgi:hypothetical protein
VDASDVFVQVTADKSQVYQNEQVMVTYTIYTRVSISSYEISKLPASQGFWAEEFPISPGGPAVRDVVIGGQHYKAATVRQVALFPTQTGDLKLDPLEVTVQVQVMKRQRRSMDPFDMLFDSPFGRYSTEQRFVQSDPLNLQVLPLPEAGKPADFSGAVGNFRMDVSLDPKEARTNEALTMRVQFSGSGNIKMLPRPAFKAPPDFESYDPKETVQVDKSGGRITGSKTYEYVLIPRYTGMQKIPPLNFSYFNTASKSYERLNGGGFQVPVAQGTGAPAASVPGVAKEDVKLLGQDVHYLKTPGKLRPIAGAGNLPGLLLAGMILPPLLALLLLAGTRIFGTAAFQTRLQARRAYGQAQENLRKLAKIAAAGPGMTDRFTKFYGNLHRLLLIYLGNRLNLSAQGLKEEEVLEHLSKHRVSDENVSEIKDLFKTCNYARFAPDSADASTMDHILKRAGRLLDRLEQSWESAA